MASKETQPEMQVGRSETEGQPGRPDLPYDLRPSYRPRILQRDGEKDLIDEAGRRGNVNLALMHSAVLRIKELIGGGDTKEADLVLAMNRVRGTSERKPSTVVAGTIPKQTNRLISGIYWWIAAKEIAREHSEHNPDEVIVWRKGRYNAKNIFVRERQMLKNPDFGNLPTLEVTLMAEDAEGVPIEKPREGKARVASSILLDRIINSRKSSGAPPHS